MKEIICEMCGSNDIIKQEGVYVCQSCGTKYTPDEAKKLMVEGTVTIDKSSEKENLKTLAKRYYDNEEWEKADEYYERIIELDPNDWEAIYYGGFASAYTSASDDLKLHKAVIGAENAYALLSPEEKDNHFEMFREELLALAANISNFFLDFCNKCMASNSPIPKYLDNLLYLINNFERILNSFPASTVKKGDSTWIAYTHIIELSNQITDIQDYENTGKQIKEKYVAKIKEIDSEYEAPKDKPHTSSCYVATCVYGSYDCPEVWTLRRFRDNTLEQSLPGKAFIKCYYAISPTIVKYFGNYKLFNSIFKPILDKFVNKLQEKGFESTFYIDK